MAIGVRDITNLEELLEIQDDDKIIVIKNGEAKLISKENAKFGGGGITEYWIDYNHSEPSSMPNTGSPIAVQNSSNMSQLYHDSEFSNPVTADEIEKAMADGTVYALVSMNGCVVHSMVVVGGRTSNVYIGTVISPEDGNPMTVIAGVRDVQ